jgi:hypothetical protein
VPRPFSLVLTGHLKRIHADLDGALPAFAAIVANAETKGLFRCAISHSIF